MILQDGKDGTKRVEETAKLIKQFEVDINKNITDKDNHVKIKTYYELGQYDLEVRLNGPTPLILELLTTRVYGLTQFHSEFYKKHVSFSKTIWQTDYSLLENVQEAE